jgi:hypothetical protein
MAYKRILFQPGIVRNVTNYTNSGGYYACDKVRFSSGYPTKIGGWVNYSEGNTFGGVPRSLLTWTTASSEQLLAFGTNQCYIVEYNGLYNNITPLRLTANATLFATTVGSKFVTVTVSAHGAAVNSCIRFTTPRTFNGVTIAADKYTIVSTPTSNTLVIAVTTAATGTGTLGPVDVVELSINAGSATYSVSSSGWGSGPWSNGGWGQATGSTVASTGTQIGLWSQTVSGDNLIFALQGSYISSAVKPRTIYWWTKDTTSFSSAVTLADYANTITKTSKLATFTSTVTTIDVPDNIGINVGAIVSGVGIPAGTYVTTAYDGGFSVPISAATTAGSSGSYTFSYSGQAVPHTTKYITSSQLNQFVIAAGANPYSPADLETDFDPMLVRWSDQTNPAEWVPEVSNQAGEQRLASGSYIVCARDARQEVLIWTDSSLYAMQYVGAPFVFGFNLLSTNTTIISPNSAVSVNGVMYWMGKDKFYAYNGQVQTLDCPISDYVFSSLNQTQGSQVICGHNPTFDEIWWFYPSGGESTNDTYVIYDYLTNVWSYGRMPRTAWYASSNFTNPLATHAVSNSYLAAAATDSATSLTLVSTETYPSSGTVIIGSETISYSGISGDTLTGCVRGYDSTTAAAHAEGSFVQFEVPNQIVLHDYGTDDLLLGAAKPKPIVAFIETSDFDIEEGERYAFVRKMLPDVTFTGSTADNPSVSMIVNPRTSSGAAYVTPVPEPEVTSTVPAPSAPNSYPIEQYTGQIYTRVRGRQMAFKIESDQLGVMWRLGTMRFDVRTDGKRA